MSESNPSRSRQATFQCCAVLLLCLSGAVAAQTQPRPTLDEALAQARLPLVVDEGGFSGAGAPVLTQAIAQSDFVLIGEDHVTREIPQFTAALCDVMHPDAFAVEAGPDAARFVSGLLRRPDRVALMAARMQAHPNNLAFLDIREENDLAAHCAAASRNPDFRLWGLDQEFLGASGTLLEAMLATAPGPKSRAAIADAQTKDRLADQQARDSGDPGKAWLLAATAADLQALRAAIAADGLPATQSLLLELIASNEIYRLNATGSPDSNQVRAELFKQHFIAEYAAAQKQIPRPRVLLKFGDNHMGKGFSVLHVRDLGNLVAERADELQTHSLHILVLGARGTHAAFAGYGKPLGSAPFVMTDDPDYAWMAPAVSALLAPKDAAGKPTLTLFDLRQLRFHGVALPRDWERTVYGYDLLVLIPELTPGSAID